MIVGTRIPEQRSTLEYRGGLFKVVQYSPSSAWRKSGKPLSTGKTEGPVPATAGNQKLRYPYVTAGVRPRPEQPFDDYVAEGSEMPAMHTDKYVGDYTW
jgi:hypothetical protein